MRFVLESINDALDAVAPGAGQVLEAGGLSGLSRVLAGAVRGAEEAPEGGDARLEAPRARHRLGALSERYESGGRGPATVSSGLRDPGGVSYGTYQLASKTGTVGAFLAAEGGPWIEAFAGQAPGSGPFSATWRAIAAREPEAFGAAQHAYIERSHYRPLVRAVLAQTGLDIDTRADAVRDACWSCAVQLGGAARIVNRAVLLADGQPGRDAPGYDRALIEALYAERSAYVRRIAARAAPGARRTLGEIVARRYPDERARALAMLA